MLEGEEKKDSGTPPYAAYAPDPLAHGKSPSSVQDATAMHTMKGGHGTNTSQPPPAAAAAASAGTTPAGVPDPMGGVPDPMMAGGPPASASAGGLPFAPSPIHATQTLTDDHITATPSSVPSPLASPVLTVDEFAASVADGAYKQPPSRPASTLSADAAAMDALASAMDESDPLAEEGEPPARRRRANTTQWAGATTSTSPNSLPAGESLQPVNFGDSPPQFSAGTGGLSRRKMSTASSSSSMGLPSASSGSLHSEHSDSAGGGGSPPHPPHPTPPAMAARSTGTAPTGTPHFTQFQAEPGKIAGPNPRPPPANTADKRQKRLERNRESARASRRRRKAYLEELEAKVRGLSDEMDRGRMGHACSAGKTVRGMRVGRLRELERQVEAAEGVAGGTKKTGIAHTVQSVPTPPSPHYPKPSTPSLPLSQQVGLLTGPLSRASDALGIAQSFLAQQLRSLVQPPAARFVLWLTLQNDGFYRGGRSASERLSAARIGERMLHGGTDRAAPHNGMWPLVCHEVGLSYEQEERIRNVQRAILASAPSWVTRHTARAAHDAMEGVRAILGGAQQAAQRRERGLMEVLTPEQRVKFLAWAEKRREALRRLAGARLAPGAADGSDEEYPTSPHRHVAANLYIVDHRLSKVTQRVPPFSGLVPPSKAKKLGRRPSFESLAGVVESESRGGSKLRREASFPSTGSLKRSLDDMAALGGDHDASGAAAAGLHGLTPEAAQAAARSTVMDALREVLPLVPEAAWRCPETPQYGAAPPQQQYQSTGAGRPTVPVTSQQRQPAPAYADTSGADDIPMPTPVSVLMQTSDEFIGAPYEEPYHEPLDAEEASNPFAPADGGGFLPEPVASRAPAPAPPFAGGSGLLRNRHRSAPQLHRGTPSPTNMSYPSFLQAPMDMIPETQGDDFGLGELPEIGVDDWAIGEGFHMDVDHGAA
ncbi:hypothetical protein ACHAXT_002190 [Thalassiosira profunda]